MSVFPYIFWFVITAVFVIAPVIIGSIYEVDSVDNNIPTITITIYGIYTIAHLIFQLILALCNRMWVSCKKNATRKPMIGVQVVGWKENPDQFRNCLTSIKNLNYDNVRRVTFCSDGNSPDDMYMRTIFREVFLESEDYTPDQDSLPQHKYVCIMNPHQGKRPAMNAAFDTLLCDPEIEYIMTTDSDTVLHPDSINELIKFADNPKVGAITGDVQIHNVTNMLTFLISLKYWFAFNVERAAQSFCGVVSCVSGPMGFYKASSIKLIKDIWVNQTFLGKKATYGDDRHLTNLILSLGEKVYFTNNALCYTDTPSSYIKWFTQQTRWGKSYLRELFINVQWFHRVNLWLAYDLIYMTVYSGFIAGFTLYLLFREELSSAIYLLLAIIAIAWARCIYGVLITGSLKFLMFTVYGLYFITMLLPLKFWSLFTMNDGTWGTGTRMEKFTRKWELVPVIIWNMALAAGIGKTIYDDYQSYNNNENKWILIAIAGNLVFHVTVFYVFKSPLIKSVTAEYQRIIKDYPKGPIQVNVVHNDEAKAEDVMVDVPLD
jgi:hyaluronan synthase